MAKRIITPRLNTFDPKQKDSLSPGDMKVAMKPLESNHPMNRGTMEEPTAAMPKKKRPLFNQTYWQRSNPHPDYLHGNTDSRRVIGGG